MIDIDLSKQQALDADPKTNQQISFTRNLERAGNVTIFSIIEEVEEKKKRIFLQGHVKTLLVKVLCYC